MSECTCPRLDGYRIKRATCPVHGVRDAQTMNPHVVEVIPTKAGALHVCVECGKHTIDQAPALPWSSATAGARGHWTAST